MAYRTAPLNVNSFYESTGGILLDDAPDGITAGNQGALASGVTGQVQRISGRIKRIQRERVIEAGWR
ncbi:MAG TPA: hypothetical protein DEF45_23190 [Rhodopirellula sp.]|nr:hypothetical protein [Rhodopirellula sp.]